MFRPEDILYEDNHIIVVNKRCGDLVQPDRESDDALEAEIKAMIKVRDHKPGDVFLGVVHRIDRPVSGAVLFAKTSKALIRLNEMIRSGEIHKSYWAITESAPNPEEGSLTHYIVRDGRTNRSRAYDKPKADGKKAQLNYKMLGCSTRYTLIEVELLTGRHHQIRAQLHKGRFEVWRKTLKPRWRHFTPLSPSGVHTPRAQGAHKHYSPHAKG